MASRVSKWDGDLIRRSGFCLWTLVLLIGQADRLSADTSGSPSRQAIEGEIAQTEALVAAQQKKTEMLKRRLEAAQGESAQPVRVAEVRKVVSELMSDAGFRESLYPDIQQVGYKKGFYIKSSDEAYMLKINSFMRLRYTGLNRQTDNPRMTGRQKQDDVNGFEVEDLRFILGGYLHDPRLTYKIVTIADTDVNHDWRTQIAWIDYEFAEALHVVAGLLRPPFGRQQLVSRPFFQLIDRSMANELFTQNRTILAGVHGTIAKRLSYSTAIGNGTSNPFDSPSQEELDTNFSYYARLVTHILGGPIRTEGDLVYSKNPQWEVGGSFVYNDDNGDGNRRFAYNVPDRIRRGRGIGGNGVVDLTGTDYYQFGADTAFRWRGFSVTAEYFLQTIDGNDSLSQWELRTARSDATHMQGGYIQGGYFLVPKTVEVVARLGSVWDFGDDTACEYAIGMNYFPWKTYSVMLQADYTHIDDAPSTSTHAGWRQNDEIDMLRVQLQLKF